MHKILSSYTLLVFLILGSINVYAYTNESDSIPSLLQKDLDHLRSEDDLEQWLYMRMDYAANKPSERIKYLMETAEAAWRQPKNEYERQAWLDLLMYQGYYQLQLGRIIPSIKAYEAAYSYYFDDPIPGNDIVEFLLKPLGNNYTRLGDYRRAEFITRKSLTMAIESGEDDKIAASCCNLAIVALTQEQLDTAKVYAKMGVAYAENYPPLNGLLHSLMANIYEHAGELEEAGNYARLAVQIMEHASAEGDHDHAYRLSAAYEAQGNIAMARQQWKLARILYGKAYQVLINAYPEQRKREQARLLVSKAQVALASGDVQMSLSDFNKALQVLLPRMQLAGKPRSSDLYGDFTLVDALVGKAKCLYEIHDKRNALNYYLLSYSVEQKLHRAYASRDMRLLHQQESLDLAAAAMKTAYELWQETADTKFLSNMLQVSEWTKAQSLREEIDAAIRQSQLDQRDSLVASQQQLLRAIAYHEKELATSGNDLDQLQQTVEGLNFQLALVQAELEKKYPHFAQQKYLDKTFSAAELCSKIPKRVTAITYFADANYLYTIMLNRQGIQQVIRQDSSQGKLQYAKDFMQRYFRSGISAMISYPKRYYQDAYHLYRWLIEPLHIRPGQALLIVPAGSIGYLPFDALITREGLADNITEWPYLLKEHSYSIAYSLQTWVQQQELPLAGENEVTGFFVNEGREARELPAVVKERNLLEEVAVGTYLGDTAANIKQFKKLLTKAQILHISTHAYLEGEPPMPVLQMSDDKFYWFELFQYKFQPGLVVLSACKTGDGMLAEGEGIISLAREFAAAGAAGVVAGLWNVNDEAGAAMVASFYKNLSRESKPYLALHRAKLSWLQEHREDPGLQMPYFWSVLTYAGHYHDVPLMKHLPWYQRYWHVGVALIILLAVLTWYFYRYRRKHL
ncbi:hypothetical protein COR50_00870 [Chitinophaga caeni]|uniref:CHAT domain-containing protein n=1 Tax=Chitinophaga caeni TaxID=2029983 RepID=A0A291QPI0_9BACT|nr:CHAT domain-containing protein [Chitinophaga caeni]ATL45825.1 hypothetical protein COR50_00870 [Chitinophaga caeni]